MVDGPHRFRVGARAAADKARGYPAVRVAGWLLLLLSAGKLPRADERRDADTREHKQACNYACGGR